MPMPHHERDIHGWNIDTLRYHIDSIHRTDERLQEERERAGEKLKCAEEKFEAERDRRYAELAAARDKMEKFKHGCDQDALKLAREIQTYKDERANQLREQINNERGNYASKSDLRMMSDKFESDLDGLSQKLDVSLRPILDAMALAEGRNRGANLLFGIIIAVIGAVAAIIGAVAYFNAGQ